ncbi:DUF2325 domain-containing protein [Alicyclobacillus macrosporangiidus]|uniref:DUF2325 domain-containing protein n=1 Tax=Alicyclobacillus macrosporangiidus TaxID=392015 RepID=A0A1I7LHD2_9BACL|nr:DUF2325 domain-containing protein [Alicyclobacillus macrosporangiidus]SFV09083.1 hypothetical protein SAMN05421543_1511 [Alicyclobacillus macrosporangiidus]
MDKSVVFELPVRFKFRSFTLYVKSKETKAIMRDGVPVTIEELWSFLQDPAFTQEEDALVQFSLDDCRSLNAYFILRIMVESSPSKRDVAQLLQTTGMRFTPKDLKAGNQRIIQRAEEALLRPHILKRHLAMQQDVLLLPQIRKALKSDAPMEQLGRQFRDELNVRMDESDDEIAAGTLYAIIFLEKDDDLVLRWLDKARRTVDPEHLILSYCLAYSLDAYLRARLRATEKAAARDIEAAKANEVDRLREENERLHQQYEQDVQTLLSVIDSLHQIIRGRDQRESHVSALVGKRILVVGDESHAPQYRAILEAKGAIFDFLPGFDKDRTTASKLDAADGILFITAYSSHIKFYALKASDKRAVLVHHAGLGAFAKAVEELERKMSVAPVDLTAT